MPIKESLTRVRNNAIWFGVGTAATLSTVVAAQYLDNDPGTKPLIGIDFSQRPTYLGEQTSSEKIANLEQSLVQVRVEQGGRVVNCNGFLVRDVKNNLHVVSAQHCITDQTKASDITVTNKNGIQFPVTRSVVYTVNQETPQSGFQKKATDILRLDIVSGIDAIAIPTSNDSLQHGEQITLLRQDNGTLTAVPLYAVHTSKEGIVTMIALENPEESCIEGASGSAIVNSEGRLVGALNSRFEEVTKLTPGIIQELNLDPKLSGRDARICIGVNTPVISTLINN